MALVIYMVCVADLPSEVPSSTYDDDLFIKQARSIGQGIWLGNGYDQFTLIKGPFHSIQIWLASVVGTPAGLWFRSLYAIACLLFCSIALPKTETWIRITAFACLLFDPWVNSTYGGLRLLREATYIPFEVVALTFSLALLDRCKQRVATSTGVMGWRFWLWLSLAGISFGLLLITREARIIVLVAVVLLVLTVVVLLGKNHFDLARHWRRLIAVVLCVFVCVEMPLLAVREINHHRYGLAISNEFEEGAFKSFYQDLISVKIPGEPYKPWVPINQKALNALQTLAPDTVLGQTIDRLDPGWKQPGCSLRSEVCDEYAGGWLMWAWRAALFQSSSPDSPAQFQALIKQSHQDLDRVCKGNPGLIDCRRSASGYLPWPSRWGEPGGSLRAFAVALSQQGRGLVDVDQIQKPFHYGPTTDQVKIARRMGVRLPPRNLSRLKRLNARIQRLRFTGIFLRWLMLLLATTRILLHWRKFLSVLWDPGLWLLATFSGFQLLVLALIQVSSFESTLYLTMVSPLLTMLVWRMMAMLNPSAASSKPVVL
jgi:hypothetical protein